MTPRGIRNANPGNLDRNATKWQGMAPDQSTDPRFVVFTDPKYGIRALAKTLMTYQDKYGLNTVQKLIDRWAPPVENDTGAYVRAVAKECRVDAGQPIDVDQAAVMLPLVRAIIRHENAGCPYTDAELMAGLYLAGVSDAPAPRPTLLAVTDEPVHDSCCALHNEPYMPAGPCDCSAKPAVVVPFPATHAGWLGKFRSMFE